MMERKQYAEMAAQQEEDARKEEEAKRQATIDAFKSKVSKSVDLVDEF